MYKKMVRDIGFMGTRMFPSYTKVLKNALQKSDIRIVYEIYLGKMISSSILVFILVVFSSTILLSVINGLPIIPSVMTALFFGVIAGGFVAFNYHYYPFYLVNSKKNSIDGNVAFAITHMAAIASAGVPPFVIFKLISNVEEYGQIMTEMKQLVRNIEVFGMDTVSALKNVADKTPSEEFKQFLYSFISNIETGGDLKLFLDNYGKETMTTYRLKREKYLKTLSTYADFYTAVLIAAPLFFVSILSIMALIGGDVFGLDVATAMAIGIYGIIPVLNVLFLAFVHYTQPVI